MAVISVARPLDGKFIRVYWQKTKNDSKIASIVVSDGERIPIKCSYVTEINNETLGDFGLVTNGKVLEMITKYNITAQDWIFIEDEKFSVVDILDKKPYQESNMYMKNSLLWKQRILIK